MPNSSPGRQTDDSHSGRSAASSDDADAAEPMLERYAPSLAEPIRVLGFWSAIVLPVVYVPLLAAGLTSSTRSAVFFACLLANVLALYVGHGHRRQPK